MMYRFFPDFFLIDSIVKVLINIFIQDLDHSIPVEFFIGVFGYFFGYVYSTVSLFFKVRNIRNLILLIICFSLKVFYLHSLALFAGPVLLIIEILILPMFKMLLQKYKENKRLRKNMKTNRLAQDALESESTHYGSDNANTVDLNNITVEEAEVLRDLLDYHIKSKKINK